MRPCGSKIPIRLHLHSWTTRTYVVSATLRGSSRSDVSIIDGDQIDQIARLRLESNGDVLVLGSPTLVRSLLANDLLNELRLFMLPIVVGEGKRLFDNMARDRYPLELVHSHTMGSVVVELYYTPTSF